MTHCTICGVLEDVGECVICEDCTNRIGERIDLNYWLFIIGFGVSFISGFVVGTGLRL